jgi:hypothetical protein
MVHGKERGGDARTVVHGKERGRRGGMSDAL